MNSVMTETGEAVMVVRETVKFSMDQGVEGSRQDVGTE